MAKLVNPKQTWERGLAPAEVLRLFHLFAHLVQDPDPRGRIHARLGDGVESIRAESFQELRDDLDGVADGEVSRIELLVTEADGVSLALDTHTPGEQPPGRLEITVSGEDETKVFGIFAQLERAVNKTFESLDRAQSQRDAKATVSIGSIFVGSGSVAVSGAGDATSSSTGSTQAGDSGTSGPQASSGGSQIRNSRVSPVAGPGGAAAQPWWQNAWLVAIVGGTTAAVIAGVILYFLLN